MKATVRGKSSRDQVGCWRAVGYVTWHERISMWLSGNIAYIVEKQPLNRHGSFPELVVLQDSNITSSTDWAGRKRFINCSWSAFWYSTIPSVAGGVIGRFKIETVHNVQISTINCRKITHIWDIMIFTIVEEKIVRRKYRTSFFYCHLNKISFSNAKKIRVITLIGWDR